MLKKLLKYDFKFLFKYWWIAAVVCLSLSFVSGFCIRMLDSSINERELPAVVNVFATLIIIFTIISFIAVSVISIILIFIRFYKNFFSDEGYLTFTLPVKRTHLLNSKIITSVSIQIATILLIVLGIAFMFAIGFWEEFLKADTWKVIGELFNDYFKANTICRIAYIIEALILAVLSVIFGDLFLFCCITLAAIITKKARVIASIGIYYVVNGAITLAIQIFAFFGINTLVYYFEKIPEKWLEPVICLVGLGFILFVGTICVALYTLQYRMLDRKLNLT